MRRITLLLVVLAALPVTAQVRLGVRGGLTVGKLHFDREIVSSDNRMGYTGGLLLDVNIPVVSLGVEASVMYAHRNTRLADGDLVFKRHYIEIPLHARYKLSIPGLNRVFEPMAFMGPTFSVLFSENAPTDLDNSRTYLSWDVGLGADLFRHLRLTGTYGLGMSRAMKYIDREYTGDKVSGKDNHWTLSVAWLF